MKKILVVDDEKTTVELLKTVIESAGYECVSAGSGEEALEKIEAWGPALVFIDVMLPELDGISLCSKLKSNPKTRQIPVVMQTALTDASSIQSAYQSGAVDYIPKPFDSGTIQRKISYILNSPN